MWKNLIWFKFHFFECLKFKAFKALKSTVVLNLMDSYGLKSPYHPISPVRIANESLAMNHDLNFDHSNLKWASFNKVQLARNDFLL